MECTDVPPAPSSLSPVHETDHATHPERQRLRADLRCCGPLTRAPAADSGRQASSAGCAGLAS